MGAGRTINYIVRPKQTTKSKQELEEAVERKSCNYKFCLNIHQTFDDAVPVYQLITVSKHLEMLLHLYLNKMTVYSNEGKQLK